MGKQKIIPANEILSVRRLTLIVLVVTYSTILFIIVFLYGSDAKQEFNEFSSSEARGRGKNAAIFTNFVPNDNFDLKSRRDIVMVSVDELNHIEGFCRSLRRFSDADVFLVLNKDFLQAEEFSMQYNITIIDLNHSLNILKEIFPFVSKYHASSYRWPIMYYYLKGLHRAEY